MDLRLLANVTTVIADNAVTMASETVCQKGSI